jgi:hypothetical protein
MQKLPGTCAIVSKSVFYLVRQQSLMIGTGIVGSKAILFCGSGTTEIMLVRVTTLVK